MKIQYKIIIMLMICLSLAANACKEETYDNTGEGGEINGYDVNLSALGISSGTLVFNQSTTTYNVEVANATASITVTPTAAGSDSTVTVNGEEIDSATESDPISLNTGTNTISIVVTAPDNITTKTYTLNVTRLSALSNNANLSGLSLSDCTLTPGFGVNTISYTAQVANSISSITVTPTVSGVGSTVTVNNNAVLSNTASDPISLNTGTNTISVAVTAQDGTTKKTYTVTVTRLSALSNNANLSELTLSTGTLIPEFGVDTISYTAQVASTISSITVTPKVSGVGATVRVNGTTVSSGSPSQAIWLSAGPNTINVVVTAQDGTTKKTYTVVVTKLGPIYIVLGGTMVVDEDGTAILTVKLSQIPPADSVVTIESGNTSLVTVDNPATVTFTRDNYSITQNVILRGVQDANAEYESVVITASHPGSSSVTRTVYTNEDDELPGQVADTGITDCWDNSTVIPCPSSGDYSGQDGNYVDVPVARSITGPTQYGTTGQYTTKDNVTGLIWKTCSEGQTGDKCTGTAVLYTWDNACTACENLNYAGRTDWRLPDWYELASIADYSLSNPAIDQTLFPGSVNDYYWSSSDFLTTTDYRYMIGFSGGFLNYFSKNSTGYVRCVAGP